MLDWNSNQVSPESFRNLSTCYLLHEVLENAVDYWALDLSSVFDDSWIVATCMNFVRTRLVSHAISFVRCLLVFKQGIENWNASFRNNPYRELTPSTSSLECRFKQMCMSQTKPCDFSQVVYSISLDLRERENWWWHFLRVAFLAACSLAIVAYKLLLKNLELNLKMIIMS